MEGLKSRRGKAEGKDFARGFLWGFLVGFWAGYLGPASQNKALYDGLYAFVAASIAGTAPTTK
jgi:hypothetical protein